MNVRTSDDACCLILLDRIGQVPPRLHTHPYTISIHQQIIPLFRERWQSIQSRNSVPGIYTSNPRLVDFHLKRLQKAAESPGPHGPWFVEWDGSPLAVITVGGPSWHSPLVGQTIGRLDMAYLLQDDFSGLSALVQWLMTTCQELEYKMLSCRISAESHEWVAAVTQEGWRHVGTSLKYVLQPVPEVRVEKGERGPILVRDACRTDLPTLERIVSVSHRFSHFFNEPGWPEGAGQAIFGEWMRKALEGQADKILVTEDHGRILGFVSLMLARAIQDFCGHAVGVLDFICVDPETQGRGVGRMLMESAFAWCQEVAPALELRTMLDNHRASAWYQRLGFRLVGADHHFHAWL